MNMHLPHAIRSKDSQESVMKYGRKYNRLTIEDVDFTQASPVEKHAETPVAGSSAIKAFAVPFNFLLKTNWGEDQFVREGGVLVKRGDRVEAMEKEAFAQHYTMPGDAVPFYKKRGPDGRVGKPDISEVRFAPDAAARYQNLTNAAQGVL